MVIDPDVKLRVLFHAGNSVAPLLGVRSMQPAELRAAVSKSPFRPFRIWLNNGRKIVVDNPGNWCIDRAGRCIWILSEPGNPSINAVAADVVMVEPWNKDAKDLEDALATLARIKAGETTISWDEAKKVLRDRGLDGSS